MSRTVDVVVIVSTADEPNVEDLTLWLGATEAVDAEVLPDFRDLADARRRGRECGCAVG